MSDPNESTGTGDGVSLSSTFLEFCGKVRSNDPSILPELGQPFKVRDLSEREHMALADALLESISVTYLKLDTENYTKSSAEAMAKFVRASKNLQRIHWRRYARTPKEREEMFCCFLRAFQESTSLKDLEMELPLIGGPCNVAFEHMLTHTQSLQSLSLICPIGLFFILASAAAQSGLKKNTTLQELTLEFPWGATPVSPILTSLRDHPLLRRLCLRGHAMDLDGLEAVLLSDTSKITELEIHMLYGSQPISGTTKVLQALARRPTLTKLRLHSFPLGPDGTRLLQMALCNIPSLQSLLLTGGTLGSAGLAELAPALCHNTSIEALDISGNNLSDMESAEILREILRSNKILTTLDLSRNAFGRMAGAVECIAEGLGSNSTLLKIDLTYCDLRNGGVSTLAQTLGSRNTMLQKLTLNGNSIASVGVGVLLETMKQNSQITDLDLQNNPIGDEGASLVARDLRNETLPSLTRLSLSCCGIGDEGFVALMSALELNTSLLHLDLNYNNGLSERAFFALAESLPDIKVLQRLDFNFCTGLASTMPSLLAGLRKNTSLFRFLIANFPPSSVPPTPQETSRFAGGWIQEMERLGYRNRLLPLIRAPTEKLPPLGVWPRALARVATLPDVIFEVLRSKPSLVIWNSDRRN